MRDYTQIPSGQDLPRGADGDSLFMNELLIKQRTSLGSINLPPRFPTQYAFPRDPLPTVAHSPKGMKPDDERAATGR